MKKIKWMIMTFAILLGVGGAMATRLHQDCKYDDQYMYNGFGYVYAGKPGIDYTCVDGGVVCSYYFDVPSQTYIACLPGMFYNGSLKSKKTGWAFKISK